MEAFRGRDGSFPDELSGMICDAKTNEELLEISFNNASLSGQKTEEGYYYSIPSESAEDELKVVAAEVTSFAGKKKKNLAHIHFLHILTKS